ncbi:MAG TPA: ROK family protein [Terriglobales bacterium]|nr:ROK family protein [Terriglobales bacterium]
MPQVVFAADLGEKALSAALLNAEGKFLARQAEAVDLSSPKATLGQICRLARELAGRNKLRGAGIAVPGQVARQGAIWISNLHGEQISLAALLRRRLQVPVHVENNRNAAVLGESWHGAARGKLDVVVLLVGATIGAGILSGGQLLRGAYQLAGCVGWMAVSEADGDEVRRHGGLDAFASASALVRAATHSIEAGFGGKLAALPAPELTPESIARLAREHEPVARQIFQRAGKLLGLAAANLISLFDPEVLIVSGEMFAAADLFFPTLKETALTRCQPLAAKHVQLKLSRLGADANLLGVARLALSGGPERMKS